MWFFMQGHNSKFPDITRCFMTIPDMVKVLEKSFWHHRTFYWKAEETDDGKLKITRERYPKLMVR